MSERGARGEACAKPAGFAVDPVRHAIDFSAVFAHKRGEFGAALKGPVAPQAFCWARFSCSGARNFLQLDRHPAATAENDP